MHTRRTSSPTTNPAAAPRRDRSRIEAIRRARPSRRTLRELHDVQQASFAIASDLDLDSVLQRVVDTARTLVGAKYGALSWLNEGGEISDLVVSGLTGDEIARIGPMPKGHGLLGHVISAGESLRLQDISAHPGSVGFPSNHPPMHSLLAVPITMPGHILGNLYLSETLSGRPFNERDEQLLQRFAAQAAVALINARLHRQAHAAAIATERERIARELHDSLAQVLAYAMTKSQAALTHLASGNEEATAHQIQQLHDAAHTAYGDVRENILGLRTGASPDIDLPTALEEFVTAWQDQSGIPVTLTLPDAKAQDDVVRHPATTHLQILRIAQEATSNIRKHAHASAVGVSLDQVDGVTQLRIVDNGGGFSPELLPPTGQPRFGLATMRERAEAIGGTLEIASTSSGTTVTLRVPPRRESSV